MTNWNTASYTMSGKELEALCQASGRTLKNFAERVGLPAKQVRSLRASKKSGMWRRSICTRCDRSNARRGQGSRCRVATR